MKKLSLVWSMFVSLPVIAEPTLSLVDAAKQRTQYDISYDGSYYQISYPNGDVAADIGVCTDVVIRSYRKLGVDLQVLVHEDMRDHFSEYPSKRIWGLVRTDRNIDHRRVPNLQVFFNVMEPKYPSQVKVIISSLVTLSRGCYPGTSLILVSLPMIYRQTNDDL